MKRYAAIGGWVLALVLALAFGGYISAGRWFALVPDVRGLSLPAARTRLTASHLRAGALTLERGGRGGLDSEAVVDQHPAPGTPARIGTSVDLKTERDSYTPGVPSVIGLLAPDATRALSAVGYWLAAAPGSELVTTSGNYTANAIVTSQTPPPGTPSSPGSTVTVTTVIAHPPHAAAATIKQMGPAHGAFYLRYGVPGPPECACHQIHSCAGVGCHRDSASFRALSDSKQSDW